MSTPGLRVFLTCCDDAPGLQGRPSALPYFLLLAMVLWLVSTVERPWKPLAVDAHPRV